MQESTAAILKTSTGWNTRVCNRLSGDVSELRYKNWRMQVWKRQQAEIQESPVAGLKHQRAEIQESAKDYMDTLVGWNSRIDGCRYWRCQQVEIQESSAAAGIQNSAGWDTRIGSCWYRDIDGWSCWNWCTAAGLKTSAGWNTRISGSGSEDVSRLRYKIRRLRV